MENSSKKNFVALAISCVFAFFYYGMGFMVNYQPDTYWSIKTPGNMANAMLYSDGRWLNSLIYRLLRHTEQAYSTFYHISFLLSLLIIIVTLYNFSLFLMVQFGINDVDAMKHISVTVLVCITITNMFSAEFFLYPDMTIMYVISISLCAFASTCFEHYMENQHLIGIIICFGCLFFVGFMSETTASIFIILTAPFILHRAKSLVDFVKNEVVAGAVYVIAMLCKVIFTKSLVSSNRADFTHKDLFSAVKAYAPEGASPSVFFFDRITFGMWIYVVACLAIGIYLLLQAVSKKEFLEIIKGLYLVLVTIVASMIPYILKVTDDFKPRIYYPLGALAGVLLIYGVLKKYIDFDVKRTMCWLVALLVTVCIVQWLSFFQMFTDQYITNYEDKYISKLIGEYINEYEEETGAQVTKVVFYSDAVRTKYCMDEGWCITQRAYDATWSKRETLNYYLDKDYILGELDPELAEYFINKNWDMFSYEQLVIKGDTAHICTY